MIFNDNAGILYSTVDKKLEQDTETLEGNDLCGSQCRLFDGISSETGKKHEQMS